MNLYTGKGVALREFPLAAGHGYADYLLFVDTKAVGVLEAKPEGHTLTGVEPQSQRYAEGLPTNLQTAVRPLPFLYQSSGSITRFTNLLDPDPRSREVFAAHQPATLAEWLAADPLTGWASQWAGGQRIAEALPTREGAWSEATPDGRWRAYTYDELIGRDKASLDIFWLRDESLEDSASLPEPHVLAGEIADDLRAALEQIEDILVDLEARAGVTATREEGSERAGANRRPSAPPRRS